MSFKSKLLVLCCSFSFLSLICSCSNSNADSLLSYDFGIKNNLEIDDVETTIELFLNKESFIDYFSLNSSYTHENDYEINLSAFEEKFGFKNSYIVYFCTVLNIGSDVDAKIENNNENGFLINIETTNNLGADDVYIPAEVVFEKFYILDKEEVPTDCDKITLNFLQLSKIIYL